MLLNKKQCKIILSLSSLWSFYYCDISFMDNGKELLIMDTSEYRDSSLEVEDEYYVLKFPLKLWRIINNNESGSIRWSPFGKTIFVHFHQFRSEYLECPVPKFKTKNMTSFVRQLNMYGFRKLRSQPSRFCNIHEFYNPYFRYGRPDLLCYVKRKTIPLKMKGFEICPSIEKSQKHFDEVLLRSPIFRGFWKIPVSDFEGDQVIQPTYQIQLIPLLSMSICADASELIAEISKDFKRLVASDLNFDLNEPVESDCDEKYDLEQTPNETVYLEKPQQIVDATIVDDDNTYKVDDNSHVSLTNEEDREVFIHIPENIIPEQDIYESLAKCFSSI